MTSLVCLPVVVSNLGSEMLYILEQRLRAQNVAGDKSVKVLHDVVGAMFDPKLVDELFKPQEVYTQKATRQIFDKLAHSSIMRLSENSMDKLYDLMTMGVKYQLVTCRAPEDVLQFTLLHLATIRSYLSDERIIARVDAFDAELRATFGGFKPWEWHALRSTLFRFLSDRRVKVSLFLQESLQRNDGRVKLPTRRTEPGALGPVGTVRRGQRPAPSLDVRYPPVTDPAPTFPVPPGGNMYSKDRQAPAPPAPLKKTHTADEDENKRLPWETTSSGRAASQPAPSRRPPPRSPSQKGGADAVAENAGLGAASELNALAGLIRPAAAPANDDTFKLNLFGGGGGGGGSGGRRSGGAGGNAREADVIEFDGDAGNRASGLVDVMRSFDVGGGKGGGSDGGRKPTGAGAGDEDEEDEEDDLLALMDGA